MVCRQIYRGNRSQQRFIFQQKRVLAWEKKVGGNNTGSWSWCELLKCFVSVFTSIPLLKSLFWRTYLTSLGPPFYRIEDTMLILSVILFMRYIGADKSSFVCIGMNPLVPSVPFLWLQKTSENREVFWFFQVVEKGCIGNKWVQVIVLFPRKFLRKSFWLTINKSWLINDFCVLSSINLM